MPLKTVVHIYLLSSENIAANGIRRICIYYEEVDKENEEIHIHEVYSIDLPNAGK